MLWPIEALTRGGCMARNSGLTAIVVGLLLSTMVCACSAGHSDSAIDASATAFRRGEDSSPEARAAYECREGRNALRDTVRAAVGDFSVLAGRDASAIRAAVQAGLPNASPGSLDARWSACPSGGSYAIRFAPNDPLADGTVIWSAEVVCSVHTPDAYEGYEEELRY